MLKKFNKMKKRMENTKKFKITPNLSEEFQIMWGGFKNEAKKLKKNN
jgi:hypothetical protein